LLFRRDLSSGPGFAEDVVGFADGESEFAGGSLKVLPWADGCNPFGMEWGFGLLSAWCDGAWVLPGQEKLGGSNDPAAGQGSEGGGGRDNG
jgi:hypothetical protein